MSLYNKTIACRLSDDHRAKLGRIMELFRPVMNSEADALRLAIDFLYASAFGDETVFAAARNWQRLLCSILPNEAQPRPAPMKVQVKAKKAGVA